MFNVPPVNEQETADFSLKFSRDLANGREFTSFLHIPSEIFDV